MKSIKRSGVCLAAAVCLVWAGGWVRAEVAAQANDEGTSVVVLGVIEGPDPIPQIWDPIREGIDLSVLNSEGADRQDGRPDFAFDGSSPVAVWAYNTGSDHDIAFTLWNGEQWDPIEFLSADVADDLDPRIHIDAGGTMNVVWWVPGSPDRIYYVSGRPGAWGETTLVAVGGRRPSVNTFDGHLRIAYELGTADGGEIVVMTLDGHAPNRDVAETPRHERLDAVLNHESGRTWIAWKHANGQLGYSEWIGAAWTSPSFVSWPDPSWIGEQHARDAVRQAVLAE